MKQTEKEKPHLKEADKKDAIKKVVALTLEKLVHIEGELSDKQKERSALKRDLNDLKEGRLDRIKERHDVDQDSKSISVFSLEFKIVIGSAKSSNLWYIPYILSLASGEELADINNSLTKTHAAGTYPLSTGEIKHV